MPFYENLKLYCVHFKLRIRNGIMLAIQKGIVMGKSEDGSGRKE